MLFLRFCESAGNASIPSALQFIRKCIKMTFIIVCLSFPKISSKISAFSLYHQKSPLMKVLHTSMDQANFWNMRTQYVPQHNLKVSAGLVKSAGRSWVTNRQTDHENSTPSVTHTHYAHNLFPPIFNCGAKHYATIVVVRFVFLIRNEWTEA